MSTVPARSLVAVSEEALSSDRPREQRASAAGLAAAGLEAALRARCPGIYSSTPMVSQLASRVARTLGLDSAEQARAELCARVRDVGMVALPDAVVLATGSLMPADWEVLNRHPVIGAEMLEQLQVLAFAAPVVRCHHERWDGEGYPQGHRGEAIPLLSRLIAVCDAFVALASDRPHRRGVGADAALAHIGEERGTQFDPQMVDALIATVAGIGEQAESPPRASGREAPRSTAAPAARTRDLRTAIAQFDVLPAVVPAFERVLAACEPDGDRSELVTAIESDTGLTVAVLRAAQGRAGRKRITNIPDAVTALDNDEIRTAVSALPRSAFPWRTPQDALMHQLRVHSQAVARAAERIAREVGLENVDDLLLAALLHDVGKLPLVEARPELGTAAEGRSATPEQRLAMERRALGLDHASVGGLLLTRWGLPGTLADAVVAHHSSDAERELATFVRLADMVAHHAHGDAVDRTLMVRLAEACGLQLKALRDALFELPHARGSRRRRAEPSPLSRQETAVLRGLAEGKVYKEIAVDLGISASTVRSHLHNTYGKLGVGDRAQAVLRATEMGWV